MSGIDKKRKIQPEPAKKPRDSRIFAPFRAIGYVSNHVPFDIEARGSHFLATTCVGNAFQTYDCEKLNLLFVGKQTEKKIAALKSYGNYMLAACGHFVIAFKRGHVAWKIALDDEHDTIQLLDAFGQYIIATTRSNKVYIWKCASKYETPELHMVFQPSSKASITSILHPSTYLNKIIFGMSNGSCQLWNIRIAKCIHVFRGLESAVTSLSQAPVIDVLAIGLADGRILVHNIRTDSTYMEFKQEGRVCSTSFRTDGTAVLASANDKGDITFWDLNRKRLQNVQRGAHNAAVSKVQFLNGQPLLVSSSADNTLKEWLFDSMDGAPRLLRLRAGHQAPPSKIDFYGPTVHSIISVSSDRSLRAISVFQDSQTTELSQGSITSKANKLSVRPDELKLPEIISFASSNAKEKYWDNVLTAHKGESVARTWSWKNKALGTKMLQTTDETPVQSVCVSCCGNFGILGSQGGIIDVFNMQSGIKRRTFGAQLTNRRPITAVMLDNVNRVLVSTSLDGIMRFWDFNKGTLLDVIDMESAITHAIYNHSSDLVAVACDDFGVRVIDVQTKRIIRELWGHTNRLTDFSFSMDGRWLVTSSLDRTIRVWDLPTGHLIDAFATPNVCTSLAFGPTGEYLATTHVDELSINLWTNRSLFHHVSTRAIKLDDVAAVLEPSVSGDQGVSVIETALASETQEDEEDDLLFHTATQLSDKIQTLSKLPRVQFQTLVNIDLIKARNKPKEAPKAPEKAPFFLPSAKELAENATLTPLNNTKNETSVSTTVSSLPLEATQFTQLLLSGNCSQLVEFMKRLPIAKVDLEIRSLSAFPPYQEFVAFIQAMTERLLQRLDVELVEAYMATFLKAHEDVLVMQSREDGMGQVRIALERWKNAHTEEVERVSSYIDYCSGVLNFLRT
ncbi:U3 snoRNP-associated protein Utp21 [Schizosaccharomyces japonicus yFS275]|uniref:U3 snoRNP-associated protein Utp21 n=1 Tax=Schizosaccharomyces japonicus (strain yFS275 / FY16936) TaxID=402676 RepID=B6JV43_SCHJY|nr:U3 snoRNP-associated protein Utp21 [Schizosaccharomyces japonicus yFS275]EEB05244.1 U3 snoRNP-associated protein Utp21 [Schizosaccharomyces japonicus yFS275]